MENIYRYFNCKIRQVLEKYEIKNIYEIRIRVNKNVILNTGNHRNRMGSAERKRNICYKTGSTGTAECRKD